MNRGPLSFTDAHYWCDFPPLFARESTKVVEPVREWIEEETSDKVPASRLKFGRHFNRKDILESTWSEVQQKLTKYYKDVAKGNDKPSVFSSVPCTATLILKKVRVDDCQLAIH